MSECKCRYGKRRHLVCRLPKGHTGRHAIRRSLRQLIGGN